MVCDAQELAKRGKRASQHCSALTVHDCSLHVLFSFDRVGVDSDQDNSVSVVLGKYLLYNVVYNDVKKNKHLNHIFCVWTDEYR